MHAREVKLVWPIHAFRHQIPAYQTSNGDDSEFIPIIECHKCGRVTSAPAAASIPDAAPPFGNNRTPPCNVLKTLSPDERCRHRPAKWMPSLDPYRNENWCEIADSGEADVDAAVGAAKADHFVFTTWEPLGVVAAITAWNSPLLLLTWKLAPGLAAGNTFVIKPSEYASASTVAFAELFDQAGFPPGVVNVICGTGQGVARHWLRILTSRKSPSRGLTPRGRPSTKPRRPT